VGKANFALTFSAYHSSIRLECPGNSLMGVLEKRWLCDDRVVYLSLETRADYGSYWTDEPVKILYDFERGTLYTFNSRWAVAPSGNRANRATTEAEFDDILKRVAAECQPANH
jgi:hypothetical protein